MSSASPSTGSGSSKLSSDIEKVEVEIPAPPSPPLVRIIPEIFQDYNEMGYKQSLRELDGALDDGYPWIIVEPLRLGDETARWIAVGNFLHKYTVISGLAATAVLLVGPRQWAVSGPLAASATLTFGLYSLSWAPDPASKYQVERRAEALAHLQLPPSNSASLLVLRRREDGLRQSLHTATTAILAVTFSLRLLQYWFSSS